MKKLLLILALVALSSADIQSDSLTLHNNARNAYGVPSVTWSTTLAATAQAYAETMASTGTTSHSTNRVNVGENLAWGSGSSISVTSLGDLWLAEKKYYIPGQDFPDVSTTGSWEAVAHYTQLMWEKTTEIGCGIAQASSGRYNYVCHYSPQGNIDGESVYTASSSSPSSSTSSPSSSSSTGSTSTQPTTGTSTSEPSSSSSSASTSAPNASSAQFITDSLNAHNNERNNYGVPSLVWNTSLASTAQAYAQVMASTGTTSHSTGRVNVGENLAWGSGKSITTTSLIGLWIAEKQYYIPGQDFPDVSTTGSWHDVAHYTAMMWEKTTDVGCGVAQASSGRYNLVCHYYVQGNIDGEPVYTVGSSSSSSSSSSSTGSTSTQPTTNSTNTTSSANTTTTASANTTSTTNTTTGTSTSQPSSSSSSSPSTSAPNASSAQFITDSLNAHNNERNSYGVPSLVWNTSLASTAQAYAQVMASTGTTSHSTNRVNVGENLAWGSGKSITTTFLIDLWIAEKQYYIPGQDFPDVSTTGSWHDVAHYTAMMWEKTTDVGCGVAQASSGRYNLVCHYYVQGNIDGEPVYTVGSSSSSSSTGSASTQPTTNSTNTTSSANSTTTAPVNATSTTNTTTTASANTTSTTNTTTGTSTSQPSSSSSSSPSTSAPSASSSQFITDSLTAHNTERNDYGVPSLVWNISLASTAQAYAQVMASTGTTSHSTGRVNVGENLAWGSGKNITTTFLIGLWIAEKQYYIPGQDFPDVSTTGSWHDVAHYTAMMWEKTTDVGCGVAQASSGRYNLVCHYYVQGNIDGEPVYTVGSSSPSSSSSTGSTSTQPTTGTTTTTPQTSTTTTTSTSQPSSSSSSPYTYSTSAPDASSSSFESDSLYAHNNARNTYGVPSLVWNTTLAQTAQSYSQVMASTGTTSHSTGRVNVGENLAWQSGSGTTTQALANRWLAEKQYYIADEDFPNVSTTGSWESVAHYTQMMWRKTTDVGCGVSKSSSGMYYYVCHYYVQGNIDGQPVY